MVAAVRVLLQHQDPSVQRRLRLALLGEPDIEVIDVEPDQGLLGLAERVGTIQPDIIVTDEVGSGEFERARLRDVLSGVEVVPRLVLVNGHGPLPLGLPVDRVLDETANRAEIVRTIRMAQTPSSYLRYLPSIYARDDFIGRFLRIFESVLGPVDAQIAGLEHYLDPALAPNEFVPWLASWLDVFVDDAWPRDRQVALVRAAPRLHRWRGTRRGLQEHLRLYLGVEPEIEETAGGLRLGPSTQLGFRTVLGESGPRHHFTVTLRVPDPSAVDSTHVAALIEAQKPAHCTYTLSIVPGGAESAARPQSRQARTRSADPRASEGA